MYEDVGARFADFIYFFIIKFSLKMNKIISFFIGYL